MSPSGGAAAPGCLCGRKHNMSCARCVQWQRLPVRWNKMRRPGIFSTLGLVISGCALKLARPWVTLQVQSVKAPSPCAWPFHPRTELTRYRCLLVSGVWPFHDTFSLSFPQNIARNANAFRVLHRSPRSQTQCNRK